MHTLWKDIPGYEGRYQASTDGQIRSVDRRVRLVAHGKETTRLVRGRILRPGVYTKSGHISVVLGHVANGSPVHALVALTFLGPRPEGCDVCHNDGNPKNNAVNNLRYDTRAENIKDVIRQGGTWRKLSADKVKLIRERLASGTLQKDIAHEFGVSTNTISKIKRGEAFAWLDA